MMAPFQWTNRCLQSLLSQEEARPKILRNFVGSGSSEHDVGLAEVISLFNSSSETGVKDVNLVLVKFV